MKNYRINSKQISIISMLKFIKKWRISTNNKKRFYKLNSFKITLKYGCTLSSLLYLDYILEKWSQKHTLGDSNIWRSTELRLQYTLKYLKTIIPKNETIANHVYNRILWEKTVTRALDDLIRNKNLKEVRKIYSQASWKPHLIWGWNIAVINKKFWVVNSHRMDISDNGPEMGKKTWEWTEPEP